MEKMVGIYSLMREDWDAYVLMMAIAYIEELSKPTKHIQIKKYKDKKYYCKSFHSVRLKMNNEGVVQKFFDITRDWESKKGKKFIGRSFSTPRKEGWSGQDVFFLSPVWLNEIIAHCGKIPNKYSYETAVERIENMKHYPITPISKQKNLFDLLKKDKGLAAGAFIVSMDLECKGIEGGRISLCMSDKYKDFLGFMLSVAKNWGWSTSNKLSKVDVGYSRSLGINASNQYSFSLSIEALKEIYALAGPLSDSFKEKCITFHVDRSSNYRNLGYGLNQNGTKDKILNQLKKSKKPLSSTDLMFFAGVGTDVVLRHLNSLEAQGIVNKKRTGKRYVWWIKDAN